MRRERRFVDDRGSSAVEFLLVGTLLTALTLAVLQLALAVYVRNVVHDAAVEGAYHAALADTSEEEGAERTREVITRAVGADYAEDIRIATSGTGRQATVAVRVRSTFPLIGLIGVPFAMEVEAHAPVEAFGDG
ncbi:MULTISPECIES: TadE/TadG family type IV pilus assembly protein [unclassified Microbacterium]|uniref:TadE/TadG family type IV pilus assembly protein n=1 Tax=unclassified Microbacterium TaxID=2609290 RepID=UPI0016050561|nr:MULTISPECIES: TadE/TadG family type IV pilus assembly protein [unclassified Microbacterium]QNA93059.1 TadE family protein [Microbacterium sp. Se63.02b]QYM63236.1 pilus assembly protein [Microbacterium sp. Se5.02b]